MPRPEVDWSPLEQGAEGFPPFEFYVPAIEDEISRLENEIREIDKLREPKVFRLVSFAANSDPEDSFVRHAAVLAIFKHRGLLDVYYEPDGRIAQFTETMCGWNLRLKEPDNPKHFLVSSIKSHKTQVHLQTLHYGK